MTDEKGVGLKGWLTGPGRKTPIDQAGVEKLAPLDKHRIAVLPMKNISPDQRDEYFAEGITDELIAAISKIPELRVIARTSSEKYKGSGKGISEISKELQTGTILEGTVRTVGNQLRVTAQLIDSQTEESLWSERYDRTLGDVFDIQTDIARNVAEGLKIQLNPRHGEQSPKKPTENSEAYTHYLKGRYFWNRGTLEYEKTLDQFELAIQKDPGFALGYSALADVYVIMSRNGYVSATLGYPKAIEFARKAIALDQTLAEPYAVLAAIRQEYEWKWDEARAGFKRAIELNPSYSTAHAWYALYLGHVGQCELGIGEAKRAIELDPLGRGYLSLSEEYLFSQQYDKAIEAAESVIELVPESGIGYGPRAVAEVERGMYDEAIADFQKARKQFGPDVQAGRLVGRLGHAYAVSGRTADANNILRELETRQVPANPKRPLVPPPSRAMEIGLVHLGLGNNQLALEWFDKAADERTSQIIHVKCEPIFSSIRGEPGFKALLKKIGLDPANLGN